MPGKFVAHSIAILLTCLLAFPALAEEESKQNELGHDLTILQDAMPAWDFTLKDSHGKSYSLKDYRGKVIMLNFWATWCPPCRKEMPSMERLHQKLKGKDFVVLALDQKEDEDQIFAFTAEIGMDLTIPILFDTDSSVSSDYGVFGLPTTYLIDKKGNMRFRAVGGRDFDHPDVEKLIVKLLQE
jgi:thiol-disulfide isomerase/thioredoxin